MKLVVLADGSMSGYHEVIEARHPRIAGEGYDNPRILWPPSTDPGLPTVGAPHTG
jgi:hypothetical protein